MVGGAASSPAITSGDSFCSAHRRLRCGKTAILRHSGLIRATWTTRRWRLACLMPPPVAGEARGGAASSWTKEEDSMDEFGGWILAKSEGEKKNRLGFPYFERFQTVGIGMSAALVLGAFFLFSLSRKGYKIHFNGRFPLPKEESLSLSESDLSSQREDDKRNSDSIPEDKPVAPELSSPSTINIDIPASREKKQIIPVEVDSTQKQALSVLIKLEIIEDNVKPDELCSRREYARWLVKANSLLERNPRHKIVLSDSTGGSSVPAFDDVSVDDPDFIFFRALAEVGIVPSKLSEQNASFAPESCLSRLDLVNWRAQLEYRVEEEKMLRRNLGFVDLDRRGGSGIDASPALFVDLLADDDKSIARSVFGNSRRLQPHKPATKAQAAVALVGGRMAAAIRAELSRREAEESFKSAQREGIRREMISGGEIGASWEEKVNGERARRREIQEDYRSALTSKEEEKVALEGQRTRHMKEWAAIDCQRQLVVSLREEVDQLEGKLAEERRDLSREKEILAEEWAEVLRQQEAAAEAKSVLEVEKEALRILRCWIEDEASKNQMRAKVLEAAAQRWKWQVPDDTAR